MRRTLSLLAICALLFVGLLAPAEAGRVLRPTLAPAALSDGVAQPLTYLLPAPGARNVSPTTALAIRHGSPLATPNLMPDALSVVGSKSGGHAGSLRLSDDRLTIIFQPQTSFAYDETVSVEIGPGLATADSVAIQPVSYRFSTIAHALPSLAAPSAHDSDTLAPLPPASQSLASYEYLTHPEFSGVMPVTVTVPAQGTAAGLVFIAGMGYASTYDEALLILDDSGEPVYIQPTPRGLMVSDFKRQVVNGVPYLVYYLGVADLGWANGVYYVMDQSYTVVDTWTIGNGYGADLHELQLLDNGHALLLSYTPIPVDLSPYGGPPDGVVMDIIIQEQDSAKNVVFEWHGSDHIPLTDSYVTLSDSPLDFMHSNAIEVDDDGHLLLSSRHLFEITKINRQTGAIIWRLGGRGNQFTFTNDAGFNYQHDIRRLPNGHITLFDNGNQHQPPVSRAVEYEINETTKTVTRTWQFQDGALFAPFMANAQRLPNGNTMIGWGAGRKLTEVTVAGSKALEIEHGAMSYRAFRYLWDAMPAALPRARVRYGADPTSATVSVSWNGATQIIAYEIWAGRAPEAMAKAATVPRSGFETTATVSGLFPATCAVKARPVRQDGAPAPFSNTVYRLDRPDCRALLHFFYFPWVEQ